MRVDEPGSRAAADGPRRPPSGGPSERRSSLRFAPVPPDHVPDSTTVVVLDTLWSATPADEVAGTIGLRGIVQRVMTERDLYTETTERLDAWADASGIVDDLTVAGTSFWYAARLRYWGWLLDTTTWLGVVDVLLTDQPRHRGDRVRRRHRRSARGGRPHDRGPRRAGLP